MNTDDRRGWRKSSLSNNGGESCVEVRIGSDTVFVRDSKYLRDPTNDPARQPIIAMPLARWMDFLDLATGDRTAASAGLPAIDVRVDGGARMIDRDGTTLDFTPDEWRAFTGGVRIGEFAAA